MDPSAKKTTSIRPFVPYAEIRMMTNQADLDKLCEANTAIFHSEENEFDVLSESAAEYFNAVKGLRKTIEHWKTQLASEGK